MSSSVTSDLPAQDLSVVRRNSMDGNDGIQVQPCNNSGSSGTRSRPQSCDSVTLRLAAMANSSLSAKNPAEALEVVRKLEERRLQASEAATEVEKRISPRVDGRSPASDDKPQPFVDGMSSAESDKALDQFVKVVRRRSLEQLESLRNVVAQTDPSEPTK